MIKIDEKLLWNYKNFDREGVLKNIRCERCNSKNVVEIESWGQDIGQHICNTCNTISMYGTYFLSVEDLEESLKEARCEKCNSNDIGIVNIIRTICDDCNQMSDYDYLKKEYI